MQLKTLRLGSKGPLVREWQEFLLGINLYVGEAHGAFDDAGEPVGHFDRLLAARSDDSTSDHARARLLAIFKDEIGKIRFVIFIDQRRGARPLLGIEPHVERRGEAKGKAAFRLIELKRREAEIHQDTVDSTETSTASERLEVAEVATSGLESTGMSQGQRRCPYDGVRVRIDRQHLSSGSGLFQQDTSVSATAEGRVDVSTAVSRREIAHHLIKEYRDMFIL